MEDGNPSEAPANNGNNVDDDDKFLKLLPPGYRFKPEDVELIIFYLKRKIMRQPLPRNRIREVELYKFNPETLAEMFKNGNGDEKELYFFTPRDRKYPNGNRPSRTADDGYWKATGADKDIMHRDAKIGSKKSLVFYKGKAPNGDKTDWIMHEYKLLNSSRKKKSERSSESGNENENDMRLDDWVLCRIYKKAERTSNVQSNNNPVQSQRNRARTQRNPAQAVQFHQVQSLVEAHLHPPQFHQQQPVQFQYNYNRVEGRQEMVDVIPGFKKRKCSGDFSRIIGNINPPLQSVPQSLKPFPPQLQTHSEEHELLITNATISLSSAFDHDLHDVSFHVDQLLPSGDPTNSVLFNDHYPTDYD